MILTIGVGFVDLLGIGIIGAGIGSGVGVDCLIGVTTGYDDLTGEGVGVGVVVILFLEPQFVVQVL
jgi:hypothetical protein